MARLRKIPLVLLITTVFPVTGVVVILSLFGIPFWIAGMEDFLFGNYGWGNFQNAARPDMIILFISAPLGLVGLFFLWWVLLRDIRNLPLNSYRRMVIGLSCGVLASAHFLYIKFGLPVFLFPATGYAYYRLWVARNY